MTSSKIITKFYLDGSLVLEKIDLSGSYFLILPGIKNLYKNDTILYCILTVDKPPVLSYYININTTTRS